LLFHCFSVTVLTSHLMANLNVKLMLLNISKMLFICKWQFAVREFFSTGQILKNSNEYELLFVFLCCRVGHTCICCRPKRKRQTGETSAFVRIFVFPRLIAVIFRNVFETVNADKRLILTIFNAIYWKVIILHIFATLYGLFKQEILRLLPKVHSV